VRPIPRLLLVALVVTAGVVGCTVPVTDGGEPTVSNGTDVAPAPEPSAESALVPTSVFVRVSDVIDDAQLAALGEIPGVESVTARREDDGALWSSRRSDGTPVDDLPEGFKISVALEVDRPALPVHPGPGEVVLTATGATHRDLDVGGVVELADRVERTVVAITDDPILDDIEFVVAAQDAASLSVRERQRGLLRLADGADVKEVIRLTTDVLGPNAIVQERVAQDRPLVLSLPETKARFGEFAFKDLDGRDIQIGASWIDEYVVKTEIPVIGRVVCNRLIIDDLTAVMQDIIDERLADEIDPDLYGGCWAPRRINRNANLSRHAWGIGIDINVDFEAPGLGPIPSDGVIAAFERHGFRWGGDYPIPDNHHFEWVGTDGDVAPGTPR